VRSRRAEIVIACFVCIGAAPVVLAACRGVLGIDERPVIDNGDGGDASADGAFATDAADDVADAFDAGPTYCDMVMPPPVFCDDFDHDKVIEYWDNINRTPDIGASGGGVIAFDLVNFRSAPKAAALSIPALTDKTMSASAFLQRTLHNAPPGLVATPDMTIQLDVRVSTQYFPMSMGIVPIVTMSYGPDFLFIFQRDSGTWISVANDIAQLNAPLIVGEWQTLQLSIKNHPTSDAGSGDAGNTGSITVRINTRDAITMPLPAAWQTADQKLVVGPITSGPIGQFAMTVDNVIIWDRSDL
jgi:hypothetical protein